MGKKKLEVRKEATRMIQLNIREPDSFATVSKTIVTQLDIKMFQVIFLPGVEIHSSF